MNFTASFMALLAAAQSIVAIPFLSADSQNSFAPVPVTRLVCDGDSFRCTAYLDFGDGNWVAQWNAVVFHTSLFGSVDHAQAMKNMVMAPVPVTRLVCDGDSFKCMAHLGFGDGRWVAQWSANVFHVGFGSNEVSSMAPVPVKNIVCDGDSYYCTAKLDFSDGKWVAQWSTNVFHTTGQAKTALLQQN